jgi:predicted TIM-barrel fold metal-dependent hydrolase
MARTVLDADGHVGEPKDLFERYLDVPLGGRRPYLTKDDWGVDRWVIEGRLFPVPEGFGIGPKTRYDVFRPGMLEPGPRLADMDAEGIQAAAIFPSVANAFGWGIENPDVGIAACRTYNNFILDYCTADPARLKAVATMPLQDPSAAAEELRRCVARGAVGAHVAPHFRGVGLHEPCYAPIYRAAQELDVPVLVHASTGPALSPAAGTLRYN